jgi:hypothetical protein
VASSADGSKLVAVVNGGSIWTSQPLYPGSAGVTAQFRYLGNGVWQPVEQPASQVAGTLSPAQIPNLDASKITSGTLSDARLSANVALRSGGNIFSGSNYFTAGSLSLSNAEPIWVNSTNGSSEVFLWPRYSDDATYLDIGSAGFYVRDHTGANPLLTLQASGTLSLEQALGDRLTLYPSINGSSYGFGMSNYTLQIHTDTSQANIVFGYGSSTNLTQTMIITGTNGNVGIGTAAPANKLHVAGGITCVALTQTSDRNAKENFAPVAPAEVLAKVAALPISTWNFKTLNDGRHMGPMAQDFYAAFGLGSGDTTITSVDPDGVALAAIQGLNQKLREELNHRDTEITELKAELSELKEMVNALNKNRSGDEK